MKFLTKTKAIWSGAKDFVLSMEKLALGEDKLVDHGMADHRAAVCAGCEKNQDAGPLSNCSSCMRLVESVSHSLLKGKSTQHDKFLKNCSVCGCYNRLQIWFPLSALGIDDTTKSKFPARCWKVHV